MNRLKKLTLRGFKSIRELDLELGPLNVLIGANGAGKSNLLSFFKMLHAMMRYPGELQDYTAQNGGPNLLLHHGLAHTSSLEADITYERENEKIEYQVRLKPAAPDTLIYAMEKLTIHVTSTAKIELEGPPGLKESGLFEASTDKETVRSFLRTFEFYELYHFHNTSDTARVRHRWGISDGLVLKEDGANLAPFLYRLQQDHYPYYRRIVNCINLLAPYFIDFVLEPENGYLLLRWRERGSDTLFSSGQAADGLLRLFVLISLLLQPENNLPPALIIDEPELGLHPYAINVVAGLLKSASLHCQVILATQSSDFMNYYEPEDIIVVERPQRESEYKRLDPDRLQEWREDYSLADLWEKNVLGGTP